MNIVPSASAWLLASTCIYVTYSPQVKADTPLDRYNAKAIRIEPGFYTAFELKRLNGTDIAFDHFGSEYKTLFVNNPDALAEAKVFRDMRITSTVLNAVGLSLLLTELVLILAGHDSVIDNSRTGADGLKPLAFALLGSGLALNVAGILVEVSSLGALDRAVQKHNQKLLSKIHRGAKVALRIGF